MTTKAVNNKIRRMMGNPHVEFKRLDKRFTTEELDEIQAKGLHSLEAEIFTLITALMVNDTRQGEVLFQIDDLAELKRLMREDKFERLHGKSQDSLSSGPNRSKKPRDHNSTELEEEDENPMDNSPEEVEQSKTGKRSKQKVLASQLYYDEDEFESNLKALTVTSDLREYGGPTWKVEGVSNRCTICNMLHQPDSSLPKTECLFYNPTDKKMKGKNMLKHPGTIYKGSFRWNLTYSFKDELTKYGFPRMGITDNEDVNNMLKELATGARKLGEKGNTPVKANNTSLDWGSKEEKTPKKSNLKKGSEKKIEITSEESFSVSSEDERE
jgi:hypothetical protein